MKNNFIGAIIAVTMLVPTVASASTLSTQQVNAIIGLLQSFGVNQTTISEVYADLSSTSTPVMTANANANFYTPTFTAPQGTQIITKVTYTPAVTQVAPTQVITPTIAPAQTNAVANAPAPTPTTDTSIAPIIASTTPQPAPCKITAMATPFIKTVQKEVYLNGVDRSGGEYITNDFIDVPNTFALSTLMVVTDPDATGVSINNGIGKLNPDYGNQNRINDFGGGQFVPNQTNGFSATTTFIATITNPVNSVYLPTTTCSVTIPYSVNYNNTYYSN